VQRLLEPEVMDTWEEAVEYDAMDFMEVNTALPNEIELGPQSSARVLMVLAQLGFRFCQMRSNGRCSAST